MATTSKRKPPDAEVISGRRDEIGILTKMLGSKKAEFLAIYGRRRVGKTYLIRQFFGKHCDFFQITGRFEGTLSDHLQIFSEAMSACFYDGAALEAPKNWHVAFRQLREVLSKRPKSSKKMVLFFDEFPWLASRRSKCLEELDFFWNDWASSQPNLILVVCGSAASWMIRSVIDARGGLHNRVTRTMCLQPFRLDETKQYLASRRIHLEHRQVIELYMALGGVPYYLSLVDRGLSVPQIIDGLFFDPRAPLRHEFNRLFASLFGEPIYEKIVRVIGKTRQGILRTDLLQKLGITSGGGVNRVLDALEESGFIMHTIPFGRKHRDRYYRLTDELSLFHLRWTADGKLRGRGTWQKIHGTPSWRAWSGIAFETLCLKHTDAIKKALGISGVETQEMGWIARGNNVYEGAQIDLVIDRRDGVISVCELKFSESPFVLSKSDAEKMQSKVDVFRNREETRKAIQRVWIAASGIKPNRWSDMVVDAIVTQDELFL